MAVQRRRRSNGLAVVAAVAGDANLGIHEIGGEPATTRAALFVDERATPAQRTALVVDGQAALERRRRRRSSSSRRRRSSSSTRATTIRVSAKYAAPDGREANEPRPELRQQAVVPSAVDVSISAEMGTTDENAFSGSALGTKWSDPNKRSSFFGTFFVS